VINDGVAFLVSAEPARAFPQKLAPGSEQGAVYLLGTGESMETPMVGTTRHSRLSGNPEPRALTAPWTPACAGVT
jgi:hypothetical protein